MNPTLTALLAAQRQADLIRSAHRHHRSDSAPHTRRTDVLTGWARTARQSLSHHRLVAGRTSSASSALCCA